MTTRSQKRKAVAKLASGEFETPTADNNQSVNVLPGPSKSPRIPPENLEEMKTTLRKEIMSDLAKLLAETQKEMMKLVAPITEKSSTHQNAQASDSETENIFVARTSTPVKTITAASETTPINSRNMAKGLLIDSTSQPTKYQNNNVHSARRPRTAPQHHDYSSHLKRKRSNHLTCCQCRKHSLLRYPSFTVSLKNLNFSKTYSETLSKCILISLRYRKQTNFTRY